MSHDQTQTTRRQLDWPAVRSYWENHFAAEGRVDRKLDPEGLQNVCHVGVSPRLNAYYAEEQAHIFGELLALIDSHGGRALDIGCGAGRWSAVLDATGYEVTGIDLQPALIEQNRQVHPQVTFETVAIQDFEPSGSFALATSVTVLQHLPTREQDRAVARAAELVEGGGHYLALENVTETGGHMYARSVGGWLELFARHGFELVERRAYDFNPALRAMRAAIRAARRPLITARREDPATAGLIAQPEGGPSLLRRESGVIGLARTLRRALEGAAVEIDRRIEPGILRRYPSGRGLHSGFLFQRV